MKRIILLLISLALMTCVLPAQPLGAFSITTSMSKEDCMDRIDEWVALNLDSYRHNVDYKNEKTGKTIIKGHYVPSKNACYSVSRGAVMASIEYTLVAEAKDNECYVYFNSLHYCFKDGGYVDYDSIATRNLEIMVDEMGTMESLGESIEVTPAFMDRASKILDDYDSLFDQLKDDSLKKSEQKKINKVIEKKIGERNVYYDVTKNTDLFIKAMTLSIEEALK